MNVVFRALNDETRRTIIEMLKKRDMTAGDIADAFSFSKPTISHHLDILKQAGLVVAEKQGQFVMYSLNTTVFEELISWMVEFRTQRSHSRKK